MVEKVTVDGGGDFSGATLVNAASETTLNNLYQLFKTKGKNADKVLELHRKTVEDNIKAVEESTEDIEIYNKTLERLNQESKKVTDSMKMITGAAIGLVFSGIEEAGSLLFNFFTDSLEAFKKTSSVGAGFNNDLVDLRRAAAEAALPLDDFVKVIQKNSDVLAAYGGTVTQGAKQFGTLSKNLRTGDVGNRLLGMGFTVEELNDSLASYMMIQSRLGKLQTTTDKELLTGTQSYLTELDRLSKATGISRKALEDEAAKASLDPIINQMMQGADPGKVAANMALVAEAGGKNLQDAMKEVATGVVRSGLAKRLVGLGVSAEQAQAVFKGADPTQIQGFLTDLGKTIEDEGILRDTTLMQARSEFVELGSIALKTRNLRNKDLNAAADETNRRNKITEAMASFRQTIDNITSAITLSLIDSGVFKMVQEQLTKLADMFLIYSPQIEKSIKDIVNFFSTGAENFFNNIDTSGTESAITSLLKDIFVALGKAMLNGIGEMFTSLTTRTRELSLQEKQTIQEKKEKIGSINESIRSLQLTQADPRFNQSQQEEARRQIELLEKERQEASEIVNVITEASKESIFSINSITSTVGSVFGSASDTVSSFFSTSSAQAGEMTDEIREKLKTVKTDNVKKEFNELDKIATNVSLVNFDPLKNNLNLTNEELAHFGSDVDLNTLSNKFIDFNQKTNDLVQNVDLNTLSNKFIDFNQKTNDLVQNVDLNTLSNKFIDFNQKTNDLVQNVEIGSLADKFSSTFTSISNASGNGITSVIEQLAKAFEMLPLSIKKFEDIDADKITNLGSPLIDLSKAVAMFSVGGVFSLISGNGLTSLADSLIKFGSIDPSKMLNVVPALGQLHDALKVFTGEGWSGFFESMGKDITGDAGVGTLADSIGKFNNVNSENIQKTVSGLSQLKTFGDDLSKQAQQIDQFVGGVGKIIDELKKLQEEYKKTSESASSIKNTTGTNTTNQIGTAIGATNALTEQQNQLNKMVEELLLVTKEMRDTDKDLLSAARGRNNPVS